MLNLLQNHGRLLGMLLFVSPLAWITLEILARFA